MINTRAALAAAVTLFSASAMAQTSIPSIFTGIYATTTVFTNVSDPSGACGTLGLVNGAVQQGFATVLGSKKALQTVSSTLTVPSVGTQTSAIACNYTAMPLIGTTVISTTGTVTIPGPYTYRPTVTCNGGAFRLAPTATSTGVLTIQTVRGVPFATGANISSNSFSLATTGSTLQAFNTTTSSYNTICSFDTTQVFQRSGG